LIEQILAIQDERGARIDAINEVFRRHDNKEMAREEMLEKSHSWHASEGELRGQVSALYEQARVKGCL